MKGLIKDLKVKETERRPGVIGTCHACVISPQKEVQGTPSFLALSQHSNDQSNVDVTIGVRQGSCEGPVLFLFMMLAAMETLTWSPSITKPVFACELQKRLPAAKRSHRKSLVKYRNDAPTILIFGTVFLQMIVDFYLYQEKNLLMVQKKFTNI